MPKAKKKTVKSMHWSQMMKNKEGKMVSVGGHNYAVQMAKMRKKAKKKS